MHILIEGQKYDLDFLNHIFSESSFYNLEGIVTSVGYYHSFENNTLVFMMPKVFMKNKFDTVFPFSPKQLSDLYLDKTIKHSGETKWIRDLSFYFYQSLVEFKKRRPLTTVIYNSETFDLKANREIKAYSYLDIINSFLLFYKHNRNYLLHKKIEFVSTASKNTNWEKTIRKSIPIHIKEQSPVYIDLRNKKKVNNHEEELLRYFYSIIFHFNEEYMLGLKIDKNFKLYTGNAFRLLCSSGSKRLRKIKYKYFSDTTKHIYTLCEMFFSKFDKSSIKQKRDDFISVRNYNIVFEDMVDKLVSDPDSEYRIGKKTINDMKQNDDGKVIDHMYADQSLLDQSMIFYIGDSKYYKSDNQAGRVSVYKQFTYARNIIQININNLNNTNKKSVKPFVYRDDISGGYNISPNYFIYGYIPDVNDYQSAAITKTGSTKKSYHYKNRLFDRDTLFLQQYKVNYLFVLKSYTEFNPVKNLEFKKEIKTRIRTNFINYFNDVNQCGFTFYILNDNAGTEKFVSDYFYLLNGKIYHTSTNQLILALKKDDTISDAVLRNFRQIKFKDIT